MHFCMDEVMALLAAVPFLGYAVRRLHAWWHRVRCPHLLGGIHFMPGRRLFAAFKGYDGTVLATATPPKQAWEMTPEELEAECKKLDAHFATVRRE